MIQFIQQHQFWVGAGSLWLFSAAVCNMPVPDDKSGKGYVWLYGTLHTIAGNLNRVLGSKIPGLK